MTVVRRIGIFVVVLGLCLATLVRAQRFYGSIFHGWDAQFYYATAHAMLFHGNLDITGDLQLTPTPAPFDPSRNGSWTAAPRRADGRIPSKYPLGLSLAELPFLALGTSLRDALDCMGVATLGAPGYSNVELWTVALGLQAIFAVGLTVLYRLLRDEFGPGPAALGVLAGWMGTSLFFYSAAFPFMAHALSFVLLAFILHAARTLTRRGATNTGLAWLGILVAMIFLVRPQQVLIAAFLLPTVVAALQRRAARSWVFGLAAGAVAVLAAVALQAAFTHTQLGVASPSGYSVGGEGFSWLAPRFIHVLFDVERGLLFFGPAVALAAPGYIVFPRAVPGYVWPMAANAVAQVYLIAAWSSRDQGDSFGARMWSDNAAVVAFGIALLYRHSGRLGRMAVGGAALGAVAWSLLLLGIYMRALR